VGSPIASVFQEQRKGSASGPSFDRGLQTALAYRFTSVDVRLARRAQPGNRLVVSRDEDGLTSLGFGYGGREP
jgi:hypothetical protein